MLTVYSYFVMDILHRGHLLFLKNSKAMAGENGRLIVGIVADEAVIKKKGTAPTLEFSERLELAHAIKFADLVVAQESYSPVDNVLKLRPDILMESDSHDKHQLANSEKIMHELGGRVVTLPYFQEQSSTLIKEKLRNSIG